MHVDAQLLKAAAKGDRKAQYTLYRVCFPVLMSVCVRYRRDEQDAVTALNNGFLKIVQHLDRFETSGAPFEAWIRRIMINTAIDEFRREKKWRDATVFSGTMERDHSDGHVDWNEADQRLNAEHLEALLRRLPPVTQHVFNLFALDGFSHREISDLLGMSEGTSKWHVSNARTQLQSWIKADLKPV
jgi:RNA polymerase sigma-70 factor (ECF subfamily)